MDTKDIITLGLAIYSAILSSFLAFLQLKREKRSIKIILQHVLLYETMELILVNTNKRPITLSEISVAIKRSSNRSENDYDPVPAGNIFDREGNKEIFPLTLQDGEQKVLQFTEVVSEMLRERDCQAKIYVYDVEGKVYKNFSSRTYNPKWGIFERFYYRKR